MKSLFLKMLRWLDYRGISIHNNKRSTSANLRACLREYEPRTLLSFSRLLAVADALWYVAGNGIPGDIVICGVYRGGLAQMCYGQRQLWLYDTFAGSPEAGPEDGQDHSYLGQMVGTQAEIRRLTPGARFVVGDVCQTLSDATVEKPKQIALLYLDTDWYASTKAELVHLYPLVSPGGIVFQDDYLFLPGIRKAYDEYFEHLPYLHRVDDTTVCWKK